MSIALLKDDDVTPGPVPAEVLKYWRDKRLKPGFSYLDVWNKEHDLAFTAAKVMRKDVLGELQSELERAIEQGIPFAQWKKEIEPNMRKLGWWEPHTVRDPKTGKQAKVDPPHRLRVIFETNMRTARAAGQWERIQRTVKSRPYLLYQVGPSARHREWHLAWHGILLPQDDDFWSFAFPPNGYGCKCFCRSVSTREADKLEKDGVLAPNPEPELDDEGLPTGHVKNQRIPVQTVAPRLKLLPFVNPRTGVTEFVPEGIDPGFNRKPGEGRAKAA